MAAKNNIPIDLCSEYTKELCQLCEIRMRTMYMYDTTNKTALFAAL